LRPNITCAALTSAMVEIKSREKLWRLVDKMKMGRQWISAIEDIDWKMKRRVDAMMDLVKEQGNL